VIVHMEKIIQIPKVIPIPAGGKKSVMVMMIAPPVRNVIVEFAAKHLLLQVVMKINVATENMEVLE